MEKLREKIAIRIWGYPLSHVFMTLQDARETANWQNAVKNCYDDADSIIAEVIKEIDRMENPFEKLSENTDIRYGNEKGFEYFREALKKRLEKPSDSKEKS